MESNYLVKENREALSRVTSFRLEQSLITELLLLANQLGTDLSQVHRTILHLGLKAFKNEYQGLEEQAPTKPKMPSRLKQAYTTLSKNEVILMGLHFYSGSKPVEKQLLLEHGFTFNCFSEQDQYEVSKKTSWLSTEVTMLRTFWIFNYGLVEHNQDQYLVVKRE